MPIRNIFPKKDQDFVPPAFPWQYHGIISVGDIYIEVERSMGVSLGTPERPGMM